MANTTHLKISTPKGIFFDGEVDIVTVKTTNGFIGVQKNRLPFISNIEISTMYINSKASNNEKICAIGGGLIYVERDYVDIFTDDIFFKEDLDEALIQNLILETETIRNELLLKKAVNKIATIHIK